MTVLGRDARAVDLTRRFTVAGAALVAQLGPAEPRHFPSGPEEQEGSIKARRSPLEEGGDIYFADISVSPQADKAAVRRLRVCTEIQDGIVAAHMIARRPDRFGQLGICREMQRGELGNGPEPRRSEETTGAPVGLAGIGGQVAGASVTRRIANVPQQRRPNAPPSPRRMDRHDDICAFRSGTHDEEAVGGERAGGSGYWDHPAITGGIVTWPGQAVSYVGFGDWLATVGSRNRVEKLDQRLNVGGRDEQTNW